MQSNEAIKQLTAYYNTLTVMGEIEEIDPKELAIIQADLSLCESALYEERGLIGETTFWKYKNLSKELRNICRVLENDAVAYYKSIRNVVMECVSGEEYLRIVAEAKSRIGRR